MKNKEITVGKNKNGKIQYLTEILPEIPTNTILYKKTHGAGCHLRRTESTPQFNHHRAEQTRYQWKV